MANVARSDLLDRYLERVRLGLRDLPPAETAEILRELARLNERMRCEPVSAGRNVPQIAAQRARRMLTGVRRIAIGSSALMVSVIGYGFACSWLLTALARPFDPRHIGLWRMPDPTGDLNLSLGRHAGPPLGEDVLGGWIIPVGLIIGAAAVYLTDRFDRRVWRQFAP